MSGLSSILIPAVVIVLVVARQVVPQRVNLERRVWVLPLVLAVVGFSDPKLIDHGHLAASVGLLLVSVVISLGMGAVWGRTVRVWRDSESMVWARGTLATLGVWIGLMAVRIGLYTVGGGLHVHQSLNALYVSLAALLLVRGLVVNQRARSLKQSYRLSA